MRKFTSIIIALAFALASYAQLSPAAQRFVDAPVSIITHIDSLTRLDMLDYYHAGMDHASANDYGGECQIVSDDSLSLVMRFTERFVGEMFVLNLDKPCPITGYIETLATPILDSRVTLYDCQWRPLEGRLPDTGLDFWLTPEGRKHRTLVEEQIPFIMYTCEFMTRPDGRHALHYKLTIDKYFADDSQPEALRYLRPEVFCLWTGSKFKPL